MTSRAIKGFSFLVMAGAGLLVAVLTTVSNAHAQMVISNDGVVFPDETEQNSAVIVPVDCPHSESIVWDTNAESWVCESDRSPVPYDIGDAGPAGGIVFYVIDDGLHGLEAAPFDQGHSEWGCQGTLTGANRVGVFAGDNNTVDILVNCESTIIVARLADSYSLNGHDDWYLPSKHELNLLYLQRAVVGGFASSLYWSSSENSDNSAWYQYFGNGSQGDANKSGSFRVRAVRAF